MYTRGSVYILYSFVEKIKISVRVCLEQAAELAREVDYLRRKK